jgi:chaperonin GroES
MRDRIIVEKIGVEKISDIIEIPDTALRPSQEAVVLARGVDIEDPDIKEGSVVTVEQWSGTEIVVGEETYWIMREEQILAVGE